MPFLSVNKIPVPFVFADISDLVPFHLHTSPPRVLSRDQERNRYRLAGIDTSKIHLYPRNEFLSRQIVSLCLILIDVATTISNDSEKWPLSGRISFHVVPSRVSELVNLLAFTGSRDAEAKICSAEHTRSLPERVG